MGSQIKFTQLYGATCDAPLSSLLEINGFTFLIDCGWTEAFDVTLLDPLKEAVPRIDAVLLSHPDTAHLGALPYAIGHLGLKAPIYATQPTCRMGQMFMYDQYLSHHANSEFEHFDLDDVDAAFDYQTVHQLKFQQNMKLTGQLLLKQSSTVYSREPDTLYLVLHTLVHLRPKLHDCIMCVHTYVCTHRRASQCSADRINQHTMCIPERR